MLKNMKMFQHTAARRQLQTRQRKSVKYQKFQHTAARRRLHSRLLGKGVSVTFQHTAARRRLRYANTGSAPRPPVSTHSRPKAAATTCSLLCSRMQNVSTHSRPKAAAQTAHRHAATLAVSTHSRPKAAAASRQTPANTGFEACDSPTLPQKAVGASIARPCARVRPVNLLIIKELFVIAKPPVF